jgi:hypothetical protein
MPEKPYLTENELKEVAYVIEALDGVVEHTSDVSLGSIKVIDVNGERLGTLVWADGGWRFRS